MRNLLLLSNSTIHGKNYLEHALDAIAGFLDGHKTLYFAPYALAAHEEYTQRVQNVLRPLAIKVIGLHSQSKVQQAIDAADVLFVGGGNTFRLLRSLQQLNLIELVRNHVLSGQLSYMGSSAGTNHASPTIRTTNDMPIVQPDSLKAFDLLPFQINPHYQDADPNSTHMGETRKQRIDQFHEENDVPVLGMREGAWLRCQGAQLTLEGTTGAMLFRRNIGPASYEQGADLSFLLDIPSHFDSPI
jgi:dipeptidase E